MRIDAKPSLLCVSAEYDTLLSQQVNYYHVRENKLTNVDIEPYIIFGRSCVFLF